MSSPSWDQLTVEEQKGWLTSIGPVNSLIAALQRLYYSTRQYGELEGLIIKAYNLWGQDWNNTRPVSVTPGDDYLTLSGSIEKIKTQPTY